MQNDLKDRTKRFALRVIRLCEALSKGRTADVIGRQLLRCGTSVGANYRAACRAKSPADFVAKMGIVEEECDECLFWMELMIEAGLIMLYLQGAEDGYGGLEDGVGWTLAIEEDSGKGVLTGAMPGAAFVIFGVCTPR